MPTIDTTSLRRQAPQPNPGQALLQLLLAINRPLGAWRKRLEHRKQLRRMPDYLLRDIGLTEADAYDEASKPFWRA